MSAADSSWLRSFCGYRLPVSYLTAEGYRRATCSDVPRMRSVSDVRAEESALTLALGIGLRKAGRWPMVSVPDSPFSPVPFDRWASWRLHLLGRRAEELAAEGKW